MAAEASNRSTGGSSGGAGGGGGAADSYIGSLISLTSKSEIRYEGILFNVNTDEASIGLRNVRSFGTEGRRKDGQQVPAIDKVYEYIVFRGSDIKDLQVKSSPPAQPAPSVHNDPAIIQSHFTAPTAPSSLPAAPAPVPAPAEVQAPASTGSFPDFGAQIPQPGAVRPTYQNNIPSYQPGGNMTWNQPPPPTNTGSGLSVPMYWQGYYGSSPSVPRQQQPLLRPQVLPMQPSLQPPVAQQPAQYPTMNPSLPTGPSNMSASQPMEFPPPLLQPMGSSSLSMPSSLLPVQPSQPPQLSQINFPSASSTFSDMLEKNTVPSLIPNQPKAFSGSVPFNSLSETNPSVGGTSASPALVTPGQFLHPGPTISQTSQTAKDVEVVHSSLGSSPQPPVAVTAAAAPVPVPTYTQAPLLPLPTPSNSKMNGISSQTRSVNHRGGRGRGRVNEFSRPSSNFTEEFDFEAMNEKFKKDEVWGHLGKSKVTADDGLDLQDEEDVDIPVVDKKPLYKKDDFFDTLSCNTLDRESRNGRTRFSEQLRLDTETFGDFSRNRGFRGGRGPGRGGWGRGGYPGRGGYGYGYGGRGRGPNVYRAI